MSQCNNNRMNSLLALLLLACVATSGASATGCFGGCSKKPTPAPAFIGYDFQRLDRYTFKNFVSVHPENAELTPKAALENQNSKFLSQLKGSVGQMTGGTKRAAEVFIALAEAKQCDDNVLALLKEALLSGLKTTGYTGLQMAARYVIRPVLSPCSRYVDQTLTNRLSSVSPSLTRFLQVVNPSEMTGSPMDLSSVAAGYYSILDPAQRRLNAHHLSRAIKELSKEEPQPINSDSQIDEQAINKYLLEPCKELQQTVGDLLEGSKAIAYLSGYEHAFIRSKSSEFRNLAWAYMNCIHILNKSSITKVVRLDRI